MLQLEKAFQIAQNMPRPELLLRVAYTIPITWQELELTENAFCQPAAILKMFSLVIGAQWLNRKGKQD